MLKVKPIFKEGEYTQLELLEDVKFTFGRMCIVVPKGFVFDGCTLPFFMRCWLDKLDPRFLRASLLHDYLLKTQFVSRSTADEFFKMILRRDTVQPWIEIYYIGVRIGTFQAWEKQKKKGLLKFPEAKEKSKK